MLLASISVVVSKWVLARGRSCGSQKNYVQVRDALYGTNPYYRTISLSSCCTLTKPITRRQEVVRKHWASFYDTQAYWTLLLVVHVVLFSK